MIKNDVNLAIVLNILNRKITKLNLAIIDNPNDEKLQAELNDILITKKEIEKGNVSLIKKVINDSKI